MNFSFDGILKLIEVANGTSDRGLLIIALLTICMCWSYRLQF